MDTIPMVLQHREDNPDNPGWWRWSRPWAARLTPAQAEYACRSEDWLASQHLTMTAARRRVYRLRTTR